MAKKGQKFNKYTPEQRQEIVDKYLSGQGSPRSLSKEYGISHKTIETWIRAKNKIFQLDIKRKVDLKKKILTTKRDMKY